MASSILLLFYIFMMLHAVEMKRINETRNKGGNSQIIRITPRLQFDGAPSHYYHQNIYFEDNSCEVSSRVFVYANSVENLIIRRNTILPSKEYPLSKSTEAVFEFTNSKDITIEHNDYQWPEPADVVKDKHTNVMLKGNKGIEM